MGIIDKSMVNYKTMGEFRFFVQKVLPLVYDDSLSYYELVSKVVKYLNDLHDNVEILKELILMFEGEGYLVLLTAFGAVGDGVTDDTQAYEDFLAYDAGMKYIPSGDYLINGVVRRFEYGCFGNGNEIEMPEYTYKDRDYNIGEYAFYRGGNGSLFKNYEEFTDKNDFKPINQTTFIQNTDGDFSYDDYNTGVIGYEVKGGIKGYSNAMPVGFRSVMFSENGGDGDVVGVWSRVYKEDASDRPNLSDACAGHFSIINGGTGTGLAMANEVWVRNTREQGVQGTDFAEYYMPGGSVGTHYSARSTKGMAQAHILISQTSENDNYGAWCVMSINNSAFKYNGSCRHPENTSVFKMFNFNENNSPNIVNWYGFAPYHVKMVGDYRYNIGANNTTFFNNTALHDVVVGAFLQQRDSDENMSGKRAVYSLGYSTFGGESHAPNINGARSNALQIWYEYSNNDIAYRALKNSDGCTRRNHAFYATSPTGSTVNSFTITSSEVFSPSGCDLGTSTFRFNNAYINSINLGGTVLTKNQLDQLLALI